MPPNYAPPYGGHFLSGLHRVRSLDGVCGLRKCVVESSFSRRLVLTPIVLEVVASHLSGGEVGLRATPSPWLPT